MTSLKCKKCGRLLGWHDKKCSFCKTPAPVEIREKGISKIMDEWEAVAKALADFFVPWNDISQEDIDCFRQLLDSSPKEQNIQKHLEEHPILLIQHLGGGHGRWVFPHKRLGSEHIPDFLIGEASSLGFEWYVVELEPPDALLFRTSGDQSAVLTHALAQVMDWRIWLRNNIDYATRPRDKKGLGLLDIDGEIPGLILIGRRDKLDSQTREKRRQLGREHNTKIHTYDWLLEQAQGRVIRRT